MKTIKYYSYGGNLWMDVEKFQTSACLFLNADWITYIWRASVIGPYNAKLKPAPWKRPCDWLFPYSIREIGCFGYDVMSVYAPRTVSFYSWIEEISACTGIMVSSCKISPELKAKSVEIWCYLKDQLLIYTQAKFERVNRIFNVFSMVFSCRLVVKQARIPARLKPKQFQDRQEPGYRLVNS